MGYTIRAAEGYIVAIEADLGNAEELKMFLNDCAEIEGADPYTLNETTQADREELALHEVLREALQDA